MNIKEKKSNLARGAEYPREIEAVRRDLETAMTLVAKVSVFGGDAEDEFGVVRENGWREGIFKTWAVPVIPFLEGGMTEYLAESLSRGEGDDFWDMVGSRGVEVTKDWVETMRANPLKFWTSLEKWRALTEQGDRRLAKIFSERDLPNDRSERIAELVWRLRVAFGMAAPFYHLEALVGGGKNWFNPVGEDGENGEGGAFDLIGMALPSALYEKVAAEKLNWNGLNWSKIKTMVEAGSLDDPEVLLAFQIARKAGVSIEDVIFAANVVEFIPIRVAGKKDDMVKGDAMAMVTDALKRADLASSTSAVARNTNAMIRFLNWFPLNHREENFSECLDWRYAAVCDTASQLVGEFAKGGLFEPEFDRIFVAELANQVKNVDATSAKGRFILSLIDEGHLSDRVARAIERRREEFLSEVSSALVSLTHDDAVRELREPAVRAIVGGKAAGLREAGIVFGEDAVVPGVVVTSEFISEWLRENEEIRKLMLEIQQQDVVETKVKLAERLRQLIEVRGFPRWFEDRIIDGEDDWDTWAVRSSSFDEDTMNNGAAAGIYQSCLDVEKGGLCNAVRKVVASFFSEKAISYRQIHGLSDDPLMAVVIQPFIEGSGGVVFSGGNGRDFEVVVGESPEAIVSATGGNFDSVKRSGEKTSSHFGARIIDVGMAERIGNMAIQAEVATGGNVDIEFVTNAKGLWILQMRSLANPPEHIHNSNSEPGHLKDVQVGIEGGWELIGPSRLWISPDVNIEMFQGELFRRLVINRSDVKEIVLPRRIPRTSHFANICLGLGIRLVFND